MSRERILAKIRAKLGAQENAATRNDAAVQRIGRNARNLVPARALKPAAELYAQFTGFLEAQSARVIPLTSADAVPAAVSQFLTDCNLPQRLRMGADRWLAALDWSAAPGLTVEHGRAAPGDAVGLSRALAGIAETGTLVLASGADNPVTLTFLPETHIVVLLASAIVGPLEEGIARARAAGHGAMPRTLNLVSGASRTADIGGRIVIGAHGPRRLAVLVVG